MALHNLDIGSKEHPLFVGRDCEKRHGLWHGIQIIAGAVAAWVIFLVALAFMPISFWNEAKNRNRGYRND